MNAKKCDACKKFFIPKKKQFDRVRIWNEKDTASSYNNPGCQMDICPDCMVKILNILQPKRGENETNATLYLDRVADQMNNMGDIELEWFLSMLQLDVKMKLLKILVEGGNEK